MLDDVFAEFDRRRRSALAEVAAGAEQVLITAAVPEDVPAELEATTDRVRPPPASRAVCPGSSVRPTELPTKVPYQMEDRTARK